MSMSNGPAASSFRVFQKASACTSPHWRMRIGAPIAADRYAFCSLSPFAATTATASYARCAQVCCRVMASRSAEDEAATTASDVGLAPELEVARQGLLQ